MGLSELLKDDTKKNDIIKDCERLVDDEVASKGGISGFAVKAGYGAVKGIKPGFIGRAIEKLLPDFAEKLDPIWADCMKEAQPTAAFERQRPRVSDALLSVTDAKVQHAESGVVKKTYSTLRGSAKKHVEEAVPRLAKLLDKYGN